MSVFKPLKNMRNTWILLTLASAVFLSAQRVSLSPGMWSCEPGGQQPGAAGWAAARGGWVGWSPGRRGGHRGLAEPPVGPCWVQWSWETIAFWRFYCKACLIRYVGGTCQLILVSYATVLLCFQCSTVCVELIIRAWKEGFPWREVDLYD